MPDLHLIEVSHGESADHEKFTRIVAHDSFGRGPDYEGAWFENRGGLPDEYHAHGGAYHSHPHAEPHTHEVVRPDDTMRVIEVRTSLGHPRDAVLKVMGARVAWAEAHPEVIDPAVERKSVDHHVLAAYASARKLGMGRQDAEDYVRDRLVATADMLDLLAERFIDWVEGVPS